MTDDILLCSAAFILMYYLIKRKRRSPRCWVRPYLKERTKYTTQFMDNLKIDPLSGFRNFTRISSADFEFFVNTIGPKIKKIDTNFRRSVEVEIRLAITLRFLATGDSYVSLSYLFKVSKQLISRIVPEGL